MVFISFSETVSAVTSSDDRVNSIVENTINSEPKDVTNILNDFNFNVFQDNVEVKDILNFEKNIELRINFKAPVKGDSPTPSQVVNSGDYVIIPIPKGLRISNKTDIPINYEDEFLGTLKFEEKTMKFVFSNIVSDEDVSNLKVSFKIQLQYDTDENLNVPGTHEIDIFNKIFKVVVPEKEPNILGYKTNILDMTDKTVNWKIKVETKFD